MPDIIETITPPEGNLPPPAPPAAPAPPTPQETPVFSEGLQFHEKWQDRLPEDLRNGASLGKFKSLDALAKSYINLEKMKGLDKVAIPTENSDESVWNEFYEAIGRPATADDYTFRFDENAQVDEDLLKSYQDFAFSKGYTNEQAQAGLDFYNNLIAKAEAEAAQKAELEFVESTEKLRKDWGVAFDRYLNLANRAIRTFDKDGVIESKGLGNDPAMVRLFLTIGKAISEDRLIRDDAVMTPVDAKAEIKTLRSSKEYSDPNHPGHEAAQKKMRQLYTMAFPG